MIPSVDDSMDETARAPGSGGLARAAIVVGVVGVVFAIVPLAVWREPPAWWSWIEDEPRVAPEPPKAPGGLGFSIGSEKGTAERGADADRGVKVALGRYSVEFGGSKDSDQDGTEKGSRPIRFRRQSKQEQQQEYERELASYEVEKAAYDLRGTAVRACRIGAISLGIAGLVLAGLAWYRGEPRRRAKAGGVLSLLALTWDYVLLGVVLGIAVLVLSQFAA